jgi:hypothetical protein
MLATRPPSVPEHVIPSVGPMTRGRVGRRLGRTGLLVGASLLMDLAKTRGWETVAVGEDHVE